MSDETQNNDVNQEEKLEKNKSKIPGFRSGKMWKKIIASIFYLCVLLTVIGIFAGEEENANQKDITNKSPSETQSVSANQANLNQSKPKNETEKIFSIGLKPDEFKDRFNQAATEFDSDLRITDLNVDEGSVQDTFQYMLTSHLGLIGSINKQDGSIRSVTILGQGDGTAQSGLNIITSMGILIAAVNPEISPNKRGDILRELKIVGDNVDILNLDSETVCNGKKYFVNSSKEIGIMFGVQDANDN